MSNFGSYDDKPFLAELYDLVPAYTNRRDVSFYVEQCRSGGGKVLELGCGTGRITVPIAAAGLDIVGLDLSTYMLAKCREKVSAQPGDVQAKIQLVQASMTGFQLNDTFSTIVIPFRGFQHLVKVDDQLACLRCVKQHLEPGGRLTLDCFQVNLRKITNPRRGEESEDLPEMELPDGRRLRRCNRLVAIHPAEQYNEVEIIYYLTDTAGKTERLVQGFPFRYFFRYEVEHLLARAGFEVAELYGDFDRSQLGDESPDMIFVAKNVTDNSRVEATR